MENPIVNISNIDHLAWSTRKKIVKDQICVVTKIGFEAELTPDALRTLHNLLKNGGALSVTFLSPSLQLEMDLEEIAKGKGEEGEGS